MYTGLRCLFAKKVLTSFLLFTFTFLLSACESIPTSKTKPIFTIENFPVFKKDATDSLQSDSQSKKISEPENLNASTIQSPSHLTPEVLEHPKTDISETAESKPAEKLIVEENQNKLQKDEEENNQDDIELNTMKLSHPGEQIGKVEETTTTETSEVKQENDENKKFKSEGAKSNELASIIQLPEFKPQPKKVEKIKLKAFFNHNLAELESKLGKPDFVLRAEEMILWQYKSGECIIDFFLKLNNTRYTVSFIDVRASRLGNKMDIYTCENELTYALDP